MDYIDPSAPPDEMFATIKSAPSGLGPRLGRLSVRNRPPIETPHYLALTSRGAVPHLTQDNFARLTATSGVYTGLEDFIERSDPPVHQFPGSEKLRKFIALPKSSLLVLGARRAVPVQAPAATPNTNSTIAVCTSVGFRNLEAEEFAAKSEGLEPDVVVAVADVPFQRALGSKRIEKATDRSIKWVGDHVKLRKEKQAGTEQQAEGTVKRTAARHQPALFAPLLPVSCVNQQYYIDALTEDLSALNGLAIYNLDSLPDLPEPLQPLPRVGFTHPTTPHDLLTHIIRGIDILTIPFIDTATDAGIALDFTFPAPPPIASDSSSPPRALGTNLWSPTHANALDPLVGSCPCYACTYHHRAYLHHLLQAKEMLAWVLLQIHNYHVIEIFFAAIRASIREGRWEEDCEGFERTYEKWSLSELIESGGVGPRLRGYQYKSEGPGEERRNGKVFKAYGNGNGNEDGKLDTAAEGHGAPYSPR